MSCLVDMRMVIDIPTHISFEIIKPVINGRKCSIVSEVPFSDDAGMISP